MQDIQRNNGSLLNENTPSDKIRQPKQAKQENDNTTSISTNAINII